MQALAQGGLTVCDVEELPTHGGSLRVWSRPSGVATAGSEVERVLAEEAAAGLHTVEGTTASSPAVFDVKQGLLRFLLDARRDGRTVAGYGAPGKGNTLLNHCGVRADLLPYTSIATPTSTALPARIAHPVLPTEELACGGPDYVSSCRGTCGRSWRRSSATWPTGGDASSCPSQL
jgi:hypothetical protein